MQIMDQFGAAPGAESVRMPDGTERTLAAEHAAAILVNEQPAFRVVCTPELLPQLALGRLLTEGWITSAQEVEQAAVCAEGLKVNVYLNHRLTARGAAAQAVSSCCTDNVTLSSLLTEGWITAADEVERVAVCAQGLKISVQLRHPLAAAEQAGQEVPSCCTDNLTLASPVRLPPLAPVPQREIPAAWVDALADAMGQGLPLYRATHAVHSCLLLRAGKTLYRCEDLGRHNALDKAVGCALTEGVPLAECVLFTSGRVPVDMVRKAIRAGVPALVSKSMPTVQSLELAEEYGLKLFIRQKK